MDIIKGLDFQIKNSAVSLGKFDGIHLGHRLLLNKILDEKDLIPTVFTFHGLPAGQRIYSEKEQSMILRQLNIAREILFPFCEQTKKVSPEQFIREILVEKMDAKLICVGEDFRFGRERKGDVAMLAEFSEKYGYSLEIIPKRKADGEVVSSTRIRKNLQAGEMVEANKLLGDAYFIVGEVVHGNALGRTIGMPTANIIPPEEKLLPAYGVYATTVAVEGKVYRGVTNLGRKPTVGSENVSVETTLLDFSGDLYGKTIQVFFHDFLRREQKFDSLEQLQAQMQQDKKKVNASALPLQKC
jgi:riboflavin kinase/FMN adenylyltransferase